MIDNPVAVKFTNEKIRVSARKLAELIEFTRTFVQIVDDGMLTMLGISPELYNKTEELTAQDYQTMTPDLYQDGSPGDGRRPLSNVEALAWLRVIRFLYLQGADSDGRVEKLARKIAFGSE